MRSERFTIKDCLANAVMQAGLPRLEAQMLLEYVLGQPRVWLIAHDDYLLNADEFDRFDGLCQRRLMGEPMAYLVGVREFMELPLEVSPAVLIPRPETELLVEAALKWMEGLQAPRVLDLGTGSGAIAVAIAHARPDARVCATDVSQEALILAQRNAAKHGVNVKFLIGSWFAALDQADGQFDLVVSNPPYIAVGDPHLTQGDLRFEPRNALTDESDGLAAYRLLASGAPAFLAPKGFLCLEHGFTQANAVKQLLLNAGFRDVKTIQDLAGHPRVTMGSYNG